MNPPEEDDDLPSLDALEGRLRRELAHIQGDIESIVKHDGEHPGDQLDEALDSNVVRIESTVSDLRRALDRLARVAPVDLSRVARKALDTLLLKFEKPLVLHVTWDESLPHPAVSAEALNSVVSRMMNLVTRYLMPGDQVTVQTLRDEDEAVLSLIVAPSDPWGRPVWLDEFTLRCRSLGDFIEELGGRFVLDTQDLLKLQLRLKLGVGVH
ncbi:MAG: hypothetical protein HZB39_14970 [Planctomycetes bacterium]|nr:hypothetical protein [Planctomycetota bacterium]